MRAVANPTPVLDPVMTKTRRAVEKEEGEDMENKGRERNEETRREREMREELNEQEARRGEGRQTVSRIQ